MEHLPLEEPRNVFSGRAGSSEKVDLGEDSEELGSAYQTLSSLSAAPC